MSLVETQALLARLYTDESLRERFLREPETVGRDYNLNLTEIEQIRQILPVEIELFAESLTYKRFHEVEKLLPLTKKVLNEDFKNYFFDFSRQFQPQSIKKHLEDAIRFADYLARQNLKALWMHDLIEFEKARLEFNGYGKMLVLCRFKYDIRSILKEIAHRDAARISSEFSKRSTFAVWIRLGKNGKPYHFVW